jgi:hypothetical protein
MTAIRDKLIKLIEHERSARAIGSIGEADNYARHIKTLMRRHKITKKSLREPVQSQDISGVWSCSCGAIIKLEVSGNLGAAFVNMLLAPHADHQLKRVVS